MIAKTKNNKRESVLVVLAALFGYIIGKVYDIIILSTAGDFAPLTSALVFIITFAIVTGYIRWLILK